MHDSREGINLTTLERNELASILIPLIDQGQSIYQILSAHPEIKQSEKCIYNYIDRGVFRNEGLINLSLKEKVSRKQFKNKYKKRKLPSNYEGHILLQSKSRFLNWILLFHFTIKLYKPCYTYIS